MKIKDIKYLQEYEKYVLRNFNPDWDQEDLVEFNENEEAEYCAYNQKRMTLKLSNGYYKIAANTLQVMQMKSYQELTIAILKEYAIVNVKADESVNRIIDYIKSTLKKEEEKLKEKGEIDYDNIFQVCTYLNLLYSNIILSIMKKDKLVKLYTYTEDYEHLLLKLESNKKRKHMHIDRIELANGLLDDLDEGLESIVHYEGTGKVYLMGKIIKKLGKIIVNDVNWENVQNRIDDTKYLLHIKSMAKALYLKVMLKVTRIRNNEYSNLINN